MLHGISRNNRRKGRGNLELKIMMRTMVIALSLLSVVTGAWAGDTLQLAADGKTDYQVVITKDASAGIIAAADELVDHLNQATGARFPIMRADMALSEKQIILRRTQAPETLSEELGREGFVIRTVGQKLVIAGSTARGTINGVYTFLEDIVGCRWYTPEFTVIPRWKNLSIPSLNIQKVPVFESRLILARGAGNVDWAARQRLNTFIQGVGGLGQKRDGTKGIGIKGFKQDPRLVGSYYYAVWHVHTLGHGLLLAAAEFDKHPEYFALVKGKRLRDGQPCMTNLELMRLIAEGAQEWIKREPDTQIISISQGDFTNFCECPNCQAAYEKYGKSGLYMRFVNQVAEEIGKNYPDMLVDTLAYQFTREPPKDMTMNKNVVIRYAPYVACIYHAYDGCGVNNVQGIYTDLVKWVKMSERVWVWSYVIPDHPLHPIPVISCMSRQFKRMRDAGVKGHLIEAVANGRQGLISGGLLDLQWYLYAKLMWDPDYDVQKGIEEFARDNYGAAAPQIVSYVKMINDPDTYRVKGGPSVYDELYAGHKAWTPIKKNRLKRMDRLFDKAEQAVAADPKALLRVRSVRLSLQYAIIRYADESDPIREKAMRNALSVAKQAGLWDDDPFVKDLVEFKQKGQ